jgi:hypothetical protein
LNPEVVKIFEIEFVEDFLFGTHLLIRIFGTFVTFDQNQRSCVCFHALVTPPRDQIPDNSFFKVESIFPGQRDHVIGLAFFFALETWKSAQYTSAAESTNFLKNN